MALAEELGYQLPAGPEAAGEAVAVALGLIPVPTLSSEGEPCAFLGRRSCSFPDDLMPCGCVAFLCPYMEQWYASDQLAELRAEVDELKAAYAALRGELLAGGCGGGLRSGLRWQALVRALVSGSRLLRTPPANSP